MRDRSRWHQALTAQLGPVWPAGLGSFEPGELLDVELGLYVLETLMPGRVALDAWTLFGGYPYGEAFGDVTTPDQRVRLRRARHFLWGMRRHREWRLALEAYRQVPQELRGYDMDAVDEHRNVLSDSIGSSPRRPRLPAHRCPWLKPVSTGSRSVTGVTRSPSPKTSSRATILAGMTCRRCRPAGVSPWR
jgi:restriction endonuclease in pPIWI_RE module